MLLLIRRTSPVVDFGLGAVAAPKRLPTKTETRWNPLRPSNLTKERTGTSSRLTLGHLAQIVFLYLSSGRQCPFSQALY